MRYTITAVEEAIVAALQSDEWISDNVKTIERYAGQLDELMAEIPSATFQAPAMFVLYTGSDFVEVANRAWDDAKKFSLIIIIKDVREGAFLRDAANESIEAAKRVLIDNDLGLDSGPLAPSRIDPLMVRAGFCVYSLELRLRDIL